MGPKIMIGFLLSFMIYGDFTCWNDKNGGIKNGKNVMKKKENTNIKQIEKKLDRILS